MELAEKEITLPFCGRFTEPVPKMRYKLSVLRNGLIVCKIKIINPYDEEEEFEVIGLIDTGAENSFVNSSLFKKFTSDPRAINSKGLSTLNREQADIKTYPFNFKIPKNNIFPSGATAGIIEFPVGREYEVILGIDVLSEFNLFYSRQENYAYLER